MLRKSPSDGSEETWSPEAASYCGQIWILQAERAGEESRQGAERNRLQRKRPVPQRNLGATQNSVPNPTQSHTKGLPSCHRRGPALRGRAALPQPQYHSVVILTPLQIRICYIFLFFSSLSSLVLTFISNYLCHFANLIRYHNKHDTVSLRSV